MESPDAFTAYLESEKKDKVFAVNYNIGLKEAASFPIVFQMILNSFQFVAVEVTLPSSLTLPPTAPAPLVIPNIESGELPADQ